MCQLTFIYLCVWDLSYYIHCIRCWENKNILTLDIDVQNTMCVFCIQGHPSCLFELHKSSITSKCWTYSNYSVLEELGVDFIWGHFWHEYMQKKVCTSNCTLIFVQRAQSKPLRCLGFCMPMRWSSKNILTY